MPLARMAMHNSGEQIHIVAWPTVHDLHQLASRHYAFEARCFVLAAGLLMRGVDLPAELAATPHARRVRTDGSSAEAARLSARIQITSCHLCSSAKIFSLLNSISPTSIEK